MSPPGTTVTRPRATNGSVEHAPNTDREARSTRADQAGAPAAITAAYPDGAEVTVPDGNPVVVIFLAADDAR
ncbi:MAG: hypothetical protein GEU97_21695 [Actinophytocola sp.]|nr:hypothetical protein [Actinophytocola sp.]